VFIFCVLATTACEFIGAPNISSSIVSVRTSLTSLATLFDIIKSSSTDIDLIGGTIKSIVQSDECSLLPSSVKDELKKDVDYIKQGANDIKSFVGSIPTQLHNLADAMQFMGVSDFNYVFYIYAVFMAFLCFLLWQALVARSKGLLSVAIGAVQISIVLVSLFTALEFFTTVSSDLIFLNAYHKCTYIRTNMSLFRSC
jgi:hypothetical protein